MTGQTPALLANISPEAALLILGLSFFFGLAFEEFYAGMAVKPPGGIRSFPLLAAIGALLWSLDPEHGVLLATGLLILGLMLFTYYRWRLNRIDSQREESAGIVVVACNLLAYLIGPVVLTQPLWLMVGMVVAAVLLLTARERLHTVARQLPPQEITTAAQFLVLTGIVLPLLPDSPVVEFSDLTPRRVWLALVAISSISYASYLLQRWIRPRSSALQAAFLGGLYSSTATTVVLARQLRSLKLDPTDAAAGIVLATAVMYVRIEVIVAIFNRALALQLLLPLTLLTAGGALLSLAVSRMAPRSNTDSSGPLEQRNPLEIPAAATFAVLFVAITLLSSWTKGEFGHTGLLALAAVVGVTDIDPFILSVAQGGVRDISLADGTAVVLVAAASNNLLKAVYAGLFGSWSRGWPAAVCLLGLALATLGIAAV
jgi:uncharacterized membrane protein (DUF4010 family)